MSQPAVIGQPIPRLDSPEKLTGQLKYTADLDLPGLLHARLVLSPHAHARIVRLDASAARALPGVVAVLTAADLPISNQDGSRKREPLARDEVLFNGHPVAVVVAEDPAVAEDAAALVEVEYEPLEVVTDPVAALAPDAPRVRPKPAVGAEEEAGMHATVSGGEAADDEPVGPNVAGRVRFKRGDVEAGFRAADLVVERTFKTNWVHQAYLEPQATIAAPDPLGRLTVWTTTQALFYTRQEVANALGRPMQDVKVVAMPIGGGFGGKFVLIEPLVAACAAKLKRPVLLALTRMEEFLAANPAPQGVIEVKAGAKRDGTLTALQARVIYDTGVWAGAPMQIGCLLLGGSYRWPSLDIRGYEVMTHKPGPGAYRAPGAPQSAFAIESVIDDLARGLGLDPLEFRLKNAIREGDPRPNGAPMPRIGLVECLERLKEHPAWKDRRPGGTTVDGWKEGVGIAIGGWPGGIEPATAICRLNHDGSLQVILGSVDLSGTNTGFAQIAAAAFGLPLERVRITNADSDSAPYTGASGGSKVTYTLGPAVLKAAEDARRQVFAIAAQHLEASPEDLELVDGKVQVRGAPAKSVTLAEIARLSMTFGAKYEPVLGRGSAAITKNAPGFAAHLARVAVDPETGRVEVRQVVAVQDVGKAINPALVEGQVLGGVAQGIGWALYEQMVYGEDGTLQTASLLDYALPSSTNVPEIAVELVEVPSELGPFGAKGVGEPPVIPTAGAIANAIFDAVGARVTEIPMTPERVLRALSQERTSLGRR